MTEGGKTGMGGGGEGIRMERGLGRDGKTDTKTDSRFKLTLLPKTYTLFSKIHTNG